MSPDINVILTLAAADYDSLEALDTGGLYTCLAPNCCNGFDTEEWGKWEKVKYLLRQYGLTGELPVIDSPCCPKICGDVVGATPTAFVSPTFTDLLVTDDLTVEGDFVLDGLFTRDGLAQPPYRSGTGTLTGGTVTIAAPWVTANTVIVVSYNVASAAGDANVSVGTITPATEFVVNGEGANTFTWIAIVNP